ncbi:unnamed protein product [Penicillium salamii]|uniref:DUF7729 domain-containing protein n=1 Tax=Penicillium salamii TaxID=1612424 RepID=A0A9W4N5Z1_9EURO|nr:unnamed protein product [Penicillium salamii]CAG8296487.1 unnamed protein product [Penicillium salamii]CAG8427113.1 unnamed protein product [Penicillium salamii]
MARYNPLYLILITVLCLSIASAQPVEQNANMHSGRHASGAIIADRQSTTYQEKAARDIVTASNTTSTDMPAPYDTLAYNFANTTSCIDFYTKWRANKTITDCHAISLLLENSNAFFHTLRSSAAITRILETSCTQDAKKCTSIMDDLAADLLKSENCREDYHNGNSVVKGTYRDLVAYEPMYRATCLRNPVTQKYCFVDAASNSTSPDDYNIYFMPLGNSLGMGSKPTCSECLQASMDLFSGWAKVDGQPLATTYLPSAKGINAHCGAGFATTNITVGSDAVTGAGLAIPLPRVGMVISALVALSFV